MSEQLQLRRGASVQIASFTGAEGEVVVDTTNRRLVLQDGVTAGGFALARLSEVVTASRTSINDAAYSILPDDRIVAFVALTASRTVTLPAAASYGVGVKLTIVDESGSCSATKAIAIQCAGSDTINGGASAIIASPRGFVSLEGNGANAWTIVGQAADLGALTTLLSALPTTAPGFSGVLWLNGGVLQLS